MQGEDIAQTLHGTSPQPEPTIRALAVAQSLVGIGNPRSMVETDALQPTLVRKAAERHHATPVGVADQVATQFRDDQVQPVLAVGRKATGGGKRFRSQRI